MLSSQKISEYLREYQVTWYSPMPTGCPPEDILVPNAHQFYRYSQNKDSYSEKDFLSYADTNPNKDWGDLLPLAVGLSVIDSEERARKNMKLPRLRNFHGIISLVLNPMDGVVKQTGVHKSHFTWWRTTSFDILNLIMLPI